MLTCTISHYITGVKQEDFLYDRMFEYLADKRTERKTSLLKINATLSLLTAILKHYILRES